MIFENGYDIPARLVASTHEDLFGEHFQIGEFFAVDGRDESGDYDHVFEWDDFTPVIWKHAVTGHEIVGCVEFEPTCVVLRREGQTVGFYMGGQSWVDPEHRGLGCGAAMVLSAVALAGELPDVQNIGFSNAGYGLHQSALRLLQEHEPVCSRKPG